MHLFTVWVRLTWEWDGHQGWTSLTVNNTQIFSWTYREFQTQLRGGGKLVFGQRWPSRQYAQFVGAIRNIRLSHLKTITSLQSNGSTVSGEPLSDIVGPNPVVELKVSYHQRKELADHTYACG